MGSVTFGTRRLGLLVPSGFFFLLSLIVLLGVPGIGTRLFFVAMACLTGLWFSRCWRSSVVVSGEGLVLRGQLRTSRYSWDEVKAATAHPMRTASPLAGRFPYANLQLQLSRGRTRTFPELAAPARSERSVLNAVVQEVNQRASGLRRA